MYKRQFYAVEHADNGDEPSSSSSDSSVNSSSDDDSGHEEEEDNASSPSRGEEASGSEDSDAEDGDGEPADSESGDEEWDAYRDRNAKVVQSIDSSYFLGKKLAKAAAEGEEEEDVGGVEDSERERGGKARIGDGGVLRVGGILKCRLCVKIICLSDETMRAHLLSKRHARSLKLLAAGKLKVQLNSDGDEDEEGETHAERLARIRSIVEEKVVPVKRKANSGRQRQRKRAKPRLGKAERARLKQK